MLTKNVISLLLLLMGAVMVPSHLFASEQWRNVYHSENVQSAKVEQSALFSYKPNELSEWLSSSDLKEHVTYLKKQGLWGKKIWLTELNGKLINGVNHYRIKYSNVPLKHSFGWYWYYGITKIRFTEINKEKSNKGFELIHHNVFRDIKGEEIHQAIWHKVNIK